jgi:DNA modification methylase
VTDASAALCEMQPYLQDADFTLYVGDVREVLAGLPDESVHCVVTSPPYWGLRDYGTGSWAGGDEECDHKGAPLASDKSGLAGYTSENVKVRTNSVPFKAICGKCGAQRVDQQLGLEPTPELYVANMVAVFREVRRVLRRDGTCWLNVGDSYNAGRDGGWAGGKKALNEGRDLDAIYQGRSGANAPGLKPKDLVGIPWRLAFALQADGWYLRSEIIWAKPNPMPESVTDRPTKSHEQVFLLTRSPRYFFDQEAVREDYTPDGRAVTTVQSGSGAIGLKGISERERWAHSGRNLRSVWEIATQAYPEAHFATYPEALVERCVKAGTSERGACSECGAPWERETERRTSRGSYHDHGDDLGAGMSQPQPASLRGSDFYRNYIPPRTLGWEPSCECGLRTLVPCVVLDPFMGSGTTALVARNLGRRSIGVELNESYAELVVRRTRQLSLLAEGAEAVKPEPDENKSVTPEDDKSLTTGPPPQPDRPLQRPRPRRKPKKS